MVFRAGVNARLVVEAQRLRPKRLRRLHLDATMHQSRRARRQPIRIIDEERLGRHHDGFRIGQHDVQLLRGPALQVGSSARCGFASEDGRTEICFWRRDGLREARCAPVAKCRPAKKQRSFVLEV